MISVVVVSWNRADDLRACLSAILASEGVELEVVVVDNGSTDGAVAVARSFAAVRVIENRDNRGFAEAVEQGVAATTGEAIALVNNDALLDRRCLAVLAALLDEHPDAAAAGGKQYFWDQHNPALSRTNRAYGHTDVDVEALATQARVVEPREPDEVREVATLSGAVVLVRRSALATVGPPFLDPLFFAYYEETDFFSRAVRKGLRLLYTGEAACWHRVRASTAKEPYKYLFYMRRNRVLWAYRNFDDGSLARVLTDTRAHARRARLSLGDSDDARAWRDAAAWVDANRALLEGHRRRFWDGGEGILALAARIQAAAGYHGHARPEVAALVPGTSRHVVDVGCGGGALGAALKAARPGLEVRGVERHPAAAARARRVLDDVHEGDADGAFPPGWPRPDCLIFADVLEHLVDPWATLRRARQLLAPGGTLVVSVPNVLHHSVASDLARGRFDYREAGVLDRTHLRFFTGATARELIEGAGFVVERMERVIEPPRRGRGTLRALSRGVSATPARRGLRALVADLCTVQYLIVAR